MRNLNTLLIAFVAVLISACAPNHSNLTPTPEELIETPVYQDQIARIDIQRELEGKEKISDIIKKHKLSKIDNGSEPIIIEIFKDEKAEGSDPEKEEDLVFHDKQQIEEYYVEGAPKIEVDETDYDEEDAAIIEDEDYEENPDFEEIDFSFEGDFNGVELIEENETKKTEEEEVVDNLEEEIVFNEEDFYFLEPEEKKQEEVAKEPKKQEIVKAQEPSVKKSKKIKEDKNLVIKDTEKTVEKKEKEVAEDKKPLVKEGIKEPVAKEELKKEKAVEVEQEIESNKLIAAWDGKKRTESFTKYTLDAIDKYGDTLLEGSLDDKGYCPNYNNLDIEERRSFWLMLVSLVVKKESGFDTHAKYKEDNGKYSRGLFQLGYAAYGDCNIRKHSKADRHDPQKNLECGVVIMDHWARKDKVLRGFIREKGKRRWRGVSRYWSVMREEIWSGKKRESLREIKNTLKNLPYCK